MISATLDWIAEKVDGSLRGDNLTVVSVSTDTRKIAPGDLFIALTGPNFDGHSFLEQAAAKGAVAAIVDRYLEIDIPQILVSDTTLALGALGAAVKEEVNPLTVGITGSCGKTTQRKSTDSL